MLAIIYLYQSNETDFNYNGVPISKALNVKVILEEINGSFYLTFKHPLDEEKFYKEIKEDMIVTAHTPDGMQPFRIIKVYRKAHYIECEAWALLYADLRNKLVKPINIGNTNCSIAIMTFQENLLDKSLKFEFTTHSFSQANYYSQSEEERQNDPDKLMNALEELKNIVRRFKVELHINGYDIRIVDRIGKDKEALLYENKNIADFADTTNMNNVTTRAYGKSSWTEHGDDGKDTVQSITARVDSPLLTAYGGVIQEKQYTNNELRSVEALENFLKSKFTKDHIDLPRRTIKVDPVFIKGQEVEYGDGVILKYNRYDVDVDMRVIGYEYEGFQDFYLSLTVGDPTKSLGSTLVTDATETQENMVQEMKNTASVLLNAMGNKVINSAVEPEGNFKDGDIWFDHNGGMFFWSEDKQLWEAHPYNKTSKLAQEMAEEAEQEASKAYDLAQQSAEQFNQKINEFEETLQKVGYTNLEEALSRIQSPENDLKEYFEQVEQYGQDLQQDLSHMLNENLDLLSKKIEKNSMDIIVQQGSLASKADKTTVNELTGTVKSQQSFIEQTAESLQSSIKQLTTQKVDNTVYQNFIQNEFERTAERVSDTYTKLETQKLLEGKADNSDLTNYITVSQYERDAESMTQRFTKIENKIVTADTIDNMLTEELEKLNNQFVTKQYTDNLVTETAEGLERNITRVEESIPNVDGLASKIYVNNNVKETADEINQKLVKAISDGIKATAIANSAMSNAYSNRRTIESMTGELSDIHQTLEGIQTEVSNGELSTKVSQIADGLQVLTKRVNDEYIKWVEFDVIHDQIRGKVSKANAFSELNMQAGNILFRVQGYNKNNVLNITPSSTYIQNATIKNAHIDSLATDKLYASTINSTVANLVYANINTATISNINTTQALFNGINSNVYINGSGLTSKQVNGWKLELGGNGLDIYDNRGKHRGVFGGIWNENLSKYNLFIGTSSEDAGGLSLGYSPTYSNSWYTALTVDGDDGDISLYRPLVFSRNRSTPSLITGDQDTITIRSHNYVDIVANQYVGLRVVNQSNGMAIDIFADTDMNNHSLWNASNIRGKGFVEGSYFKNLSDRRLKENIKDAEIDSLQLIKNLSFKTYDYIDGEKNMFGLIANDLNDLIRRKDEKGYYGIDMTAYSHLTAHALQRLIMKVEQLERKLI